MIRSKILENYSFEAYDRFVGKRDEAEAIVADPNAIVSTLICYMSRQGNSFQVKFTRRLVEGAIRVFGPQYASRFTLPSHWKFVYFNIVQFKLVMIHLQSLASSWMVARQLFAEQGILGVGYSSSVWVVKKHELVNLISRSSKLTPSVIKSILKYLTFGECEVRNPDIAIQPIIDLENESYAIAPLLLMHTNAERNLCVLLNQIPAEKKNYSSLVHEKENHLFEMIVKALSATSLECCSGEVEGTDVDIAIIDRDKKICLCVELKWFIEPAEIREVEMRCEELAKGIQQGRRLINLFNSRNEKLFSKLKIDETYYFQAVVGSENFIGKDEIQDEKVPIVKVWHLLSKIVASDLKETIDWLMQGEYLPQESLDFEVRKMPITIGGWRAEWYGLRPL